MTDRTINTLLIGSQKSGTTSLYHCLNEHPDICWSTVKELAQFVDDDPDLTSEALREWFPPETDSRVIATGHVHMLVCNESPARAHAINPDMKLIVMLRDPVDRAWSAYNYAVANGWLDDSQGFIHALDHEAESLRSTSGRTRFDIAFASNGLYAHHLAKWTALFERRQLHIIRLSDFKSDPDAVLAGVCRFLDINPIAAAAENQSRNEAREFKWKGLAKLVFSRDSRLKAVLRRLLPTRVRAWVRGSVIPVMNRINQKAPEKRAMPDEVQRRLRDYYAADRARLLEEFGVEV